MNQLNRITLRFRSREIEHEFAVYVAGAQLISVRVALGIGIFLNSIYSLWDLLIFSADNLARIFVLREVFHNAWLLALLGLSFLPYFRQRANVLFVVGAVAFTIFYAGINTFEQTPYIFVANGIFIVIAPYLFMIGNFLLANATAVASALLFAAIIGFARSLDGEYIIFVLLLGTAGILGAPYLYQVELLRRREFVTARALARERQRFRDLLVRVLPERVANRLQDNHTVSDSYDKVVVMFADVVGFTAMSAQFEPSFVVAWLNELFSKFDAVIARHGLEKIKTIGDAYMAAGGLDVYILHGQCERSVAAAVELVEIAQRHLRPDGTPSEIRVGIHCGPALAGIIGEHRFLYDLWGDTVNVASRMEAASRPGAVLVTTEVRNEVADLYEFEECPDTLIRGRGSMTTWLLRGRRSESSGANKEPRKTA